MTGLTPEQKQVGSDNYYEALGVSREDVNRELGVVEPSSDGDGDGGNTGMILAIIFGALAAAILIFLLIYYLKRRGSKQEKPDRGKKLTT